MQAKQLDLKNKYLSLIAGIYYGFQGPKWA